MRSHSSIVARMVILVFVFLYAAPAGFGGAGSTQSAHAAVGTFSSVVAPGAAQMPMTLPLQATGAVTPTATTVLTPTATAVLTAKPSLTSDPSTFGPGDNIVVQGKSFAAGEAITISLATTSGSASVTIGSTHADASGNFGPKTIQIPFDAPAGQIVVVAFGQQSGRRATIQVTVHAPVATLLIAPTSAKPDTAIAVSGTHFQPGEYVVVDLVALASSAKLGTTRANSAGVFTMHATVPANTPEGTLSVVATGLTSHLSSTAQIAVGALPAILTIGSGSVKAGDTLSVSGKGFIPGETISVRLTGGSPGTLDPGYHRRQHGGRVHYRQAGYPDTRPVRLVYSHRVGTEQRTFRPASPYRAGTATGGADT